jgi:eukaryotic-like serine/threonine-protein kinase
MMYVMARTYGNWGCTRALMKLAKRALDARTSLLGPDDPRTLESMTLMGWILDREGSEAEAEKMERQALAGERRILGPEDPLTLRDRWMTWPHPAAWGPLREEEKLEREAIGETRVLGPESTQTLQSMNHLGVSLLLQSRFAEAEQEYRRLLDVERRVLGPDHPETLKALANLSTSLQGQQPLCGGRAALSRSFGHPPACARPRTSEHTPRHVQPGWASGFRRPPGGLREPVA